MLNKIFNPDNAFFRVMGVLVDVFAFSLMWLVCAATVVGLGPGTAALYDAMARCMSRGNTGGYLRFWSSLKANFKVGCPAGLLVVAAGYGLSKLNAVLYAQALGGGAMIVVFLFFRLLLVVLCGMAAWIFPVLSRFTFGVGGLLAASAKLALAHPLVTVALGVLTGACIWVSYVYWLPALVLPYLWARAAEPLLERVFKPFMEAQGEA